MQAKRNVDYSRQKIAYNMKNLQTILNTIDSDEPNNKNVEKLIYKSI